MAYTSALLATVLNTASAVYDESRSRQYAQLAAAAYCPADSLVNWSCSGTYCIEGVSSVSVCQGTSTQAFVAEWEGRCLISFEGSHTVQSFITDLQVIEDPVPWSSCSNCRVHGGFISEWESHVDCIEAKLQTRGCSELRITGHSLGASVATLAALDLSRSGWSIEEVYTFGMPRTGDRNFAERADSVLKGKFFRITHGKDPVPNAIPDELIVDLGYEHVEPEIYYSGHISEGYDVCTVAHQNERCVEYWWDLPSDILLHVGDHLDYMDTATPGATECSGATANTTMVL